MGAILRRAPAGQRDARASADFAPPVSYRRAMAELPAWAVDNRTAVEREASPYRGLSSEERWGLMVAACRGAARQIRNRSDRERILAYRDPLPASSAAILRRLREENRTRR